VKGLVDNGALMDMVTGMLLGLLLQATPIRFADLDEILTYWQGPTAG
jgi:hypothetical protein